MLSISGEHSATTIVATIAISAALSSISAFCLYLLRRRYVFAHTLATSKRCEYILSTLTQEFSNRYSIPPTHITPYQIAQAAYTAPAVKMKYDNVKIFERSNPDSFCHAAVSTEFMNLIAKQMMAEDSVDIVVFLPPFGGTHYMRPVRRLIAEVERRGVPVACLLDRNTVGYEFPFECDPLRNSYLDHHDAYLIIEFLVECVCIMETAKQMQYKLTQDQLLQHAALRLCPLSSGSGDTKKSELLTQQQASTPIHMRFHFVGYSLGAMRITHILIDKELGSKLQEIRQDATARYPSIKAEIAIRSAALCYATFDVDAPLNHPKQIQRMLARHLISEINTNLDKRNYLLKHLSAKVDDPEDTLKRGTSSGLLSDLDRNISCALYGFDTYKEYYQELLPTNRIHRFASSVPVLFINSRDDFITGPRVPTDQIQKHPQAVYIALNAGGHLGTTIANGEDVCSKIVARWVSLQK